MLTVYFVVDDIVLHLEYKAKTRTTAVQTQVEDYFLFYVVSFRNTGRDYN